MLANHVSVTALRTLPMFQGIAMDKLEAIARCAVLRRVTRGTAVVLAGDSTDNVYFVMNGNLKVIVSDDDGREVILTMLSHGDVFGEMGVFDKEPRSATVTAVAAVDLIVISQADFRQILQDNFELCLRIMGNLSQRLREADRKIESLALMDVYGRVARLLLDMAETSGGQTVVRKKISKQDIAKMIGASREMVSRVMKDLHTRGLIDETDSGVVLHEQIHAV
ncbi:Crp/Fnr family transcriptional regulator [Uliginosibacterium sediminicola]|uniref:Cyclic nucleotide-binding domain-containing protein n=1 Tax=Uliginosibacterium sediminicola TaxID=2024550 RepID=A0ABU9Z0I5_9RHOO